MTSSRRSARVSELLPHTEAPPELESEDDIAKQHGDDEDPHMMDFGHDGGPHGPGQEGDDHELQNVNAVNDVGAELGLNALRDSPEGVKPFYPYSTLIRMSQSIHARVQCPFLGD
jgi:hypothetical protein